MKAGCALVTYQDMKYLSTKRGIDNLVILEALYYMYDANFGTKDKISAAAGQTIHSATQLSSFPLPSPLITPDHYTFRLHSPSNSLRARRQTRSTSPSHSCFIPEFFRTMFTAAFTTPMYLRGSNAFHPVTTQIRPRGFSTTYLPSRTVLWRASSIPESEKSGGSAEDDTLSVEFRQKVNELFGGRQNVKIEMEADSGVQFTVRNKNYGTDYQQTKYAWAVISSIAVISVVAGLAFAVLFYSGAVHGSDQQERRYEMPTYGKSSYINPYELIEERQLRDANVLPDY